MNNRLEDKTTKCSQTNEFEDISEQNITIELQLSSDPNQCLEQSLSSLLIPGYLLVRSTSDVGTYHLQQTVMQIDVESDQTFTTNATNLQNTDFSTINCITSEVPIDRPDQQIIVSNTLVNNCDNNGMNSSLIAKTNKSITDLNISQNKIENKLILIENKDKTIDSNESKRKVSKKSKTDEKSGRHLPPSRSARVNCLVCNKQFKKSYIREHMTIHDNHKPYQCQICGKTYRWRTLLRNHKKTHLADNPFTCEFCDLRMSSKFSVQQHVLKVHQNLEKNFECNQCSKKYVTIHQLRAHQKFHSEDRTRQCEYCGKVYKHMQSLERHRRLHKGEENSVDLRLKCSSCGLICHSKTHFTAHQRIHTGEKPFVCETCGKNYRQIAQLNQHRIVHTDLRPFKCTSCDRTFRCRSNLRLHLDHHKGVKRHSCSYCGQKFFSYPNMLKHIRRTHLGLRPFKCDLCENKSFCEKQELQNHMRTHRGEKRPTPKRKRLPLPSPANDKCSESDQNVTEKESIPH